MWGFKDIAIIQIGKAFLNKEGRKRANSTVSSVFLQPIVEGVENYKMLYKRKRRRAILLLIAFLLLMVFVLTFSVLLFNSGNNIISYNETGYVIAMGQEDVSSDQKVVVSNFLDSFKGTVELFTPIFDSFISETADVTGKSRPAGNAYQINLFGSYEAEFVTGSTMRPASFYYTKLLALVVPIAVLAIVFQGFNIMTNAEDNANKIKELVTRFILAVSMLVFTPYILSGSIIGMNLLVKELTGGQQLTEFITEFVDTVKQGYEAGTGDQINNTLNSVFSLGTNNIVAFFQSLPIILPFVLILLLFLYVSFQFIIRYLNLYFLACIYPFAIVFYIHPSTRMYPTNFWKQWITFLIHQPVFVLGYIIVQDLLFDMLEAGPQFEQVLIFLAMLLFLATINQISARIWGDVFTAVSTNIQSALGTAMAYRGATAPVRRAGSVAQDFKRGAVGGHISGFGSALGRNFGEKSGIISSISGKKAGTSFNGGVNPTKSGGLSSSVIPSGQSADAVQHTRLNDATQSEFGRSLTGNGLDVTASDPENGVLSVGGDFYASRDEKTGVSTLYTSEADAKLDGIDKSSLTKISGSSFNIKDTSNNLGRKEYNKTIGKYAKEQGFKGTVHLTPSADDSRVANNMKFAKGYNEARGIDGVVIQRFAKNAPKGDENGKINKIHIYNEVLDGQSETN